MAILTRVKINPQQRYDLEDLLVDQSAARTDEKLWIQKFLSENNLIVSGFTVSGLGLTSATVAMTGCALIVPQNADDFSYFVSAPVEPNVVIPDSDLADGARNYVEVELATLDGTPLTKAFWDPDANSGNGSEFNQIVNTVTDLTVKFVVSTGGFTGTPNRLPIAILDVDGSGLIKIILDRRELFGRLAKPNDLDNEYAWGTKVDSTFALNMTGVSGTFTAGEEITIGSETATVVTGGGSSISFNEPTGINFQNGSAVVGTSSGATGTVNTVLESFTGVDKSLKGQKMINDALMTEIKKMKKRRFWWQDSPTLIGLKTEVLSAIAPVASGAKVKWDGSSLIITDDSLTPATGDSVAAIRVLNSTANLMLARQDDGKEVVTITLSAIPDDGILSLDQDGNIVQINWNDDTATIQAAWDLSASEPATISGNPASQKIVITYDSPGVQVDVLVDSNSLVKDASPVTETLTIKKGMAVDESISLADGELLYVDLPDPLANTIYNGVGVGAANYKITTRGSAAVTDATYWLAYREGSRLIWRFSGALEAGESSEVSDNIPQSLLDAIGLASEASLPNYSSDLRGVLEESIVKRVGTLTDATGDAQEDRSAFMRSDATLTWSSSGDLSFASDIILEIINTKAGGSGLHTIETADSPINLADGECAWVRVQRGNSSELLTVQVTDSNSVPPQTQAEKDVFVLFARRDVGADVYLHIPLLKQTIGPNQTFRLGALDFVDASPSQRGLVNITAQTFGGDKTFQDDLIAGSTLQLQEAIDAAATGSSALVALPTKSFVKLTNGSLVSITGIGAGAQGQVLVLTNGTGNAITVLNDIGGTAANRIVTGTANDLSLENNATLHLIYDSNSSRWRVVGGSGSGGRYTEFTLANGQISAANITGLTVDQLLNKGFDLEYTIFRSINGGPADGLEDALFYTGGIGTGFNNNVTSVSVSPTTQQIVFGGGFTQFKGNTRNYLVRTTSSGVEDVTFYTNQGTGFNSTIFSVAHQADGKILVGGSFTTLNGVTVNKFARLNADGTPDTTFNANAGKFSSGVGLDVYAIAVQADGKIVVGGNFQQFNALTRDRLLRLNSDGTEDAAFFTAMGGIGADFPVRAILVQPDQKIVVVGEFSVVGSGIPRDGITRLGTTGAPDGAFLAGIGGSGANNVVRTVSIQPDGKLLLGGDFSAWNSVSRGRIVRINSTGSLDTAFVTNLGTGFDASVRGIIVQSDGSLVIGGVFTTLNGIARDSLVRLDSTGLEIAGFNTNIGTSVAPNQLFGLAQDSLGGIICHGLMTSFNGNTRNGAFRLANTVTDALKRGSLMGRYRAGNPTNSKWELAGEVSIGDATDVVLSMTDAGQIQYTTTAVVGTIIASYIRYILTKL